MEAILSLSLPSSSVTLSIIGVTETPASRSFDAVVLSSSVTPCTIGTRLSSTLDDDEATLSDSPMAASARLRQAERIVSVAPVQVCLSEPICPPILAVAPATPSLPCSMPSTSASIAHFDSTVPFDMRLRISSTDTPDLLASICSAWTPLSESDHMSSSDTLLWALILPSVSVMAAKAA